MPDEPIDRILDAAYACFARHGVRRTTMDDIATAAGMSRPAVYQYVRNKDDAFRRLCDRLFQSALAQARVAGAHVGPLIDRLHAALAVKLELTLKLVRDSPHAAELLDENARLSGELVEQFKVAMRDLLVEVIEDGDERGEIALGSATAVEIAELVLALNHGLEANLTDPEIPRRRLRLGLELMVTGLARR